MKSAVALAALPEYQPEPSAPPRIGLALGKFASPFASPRSWLHEWRNPDDSVSLQLARLPTPSSYLLRAPGFCDFHIDTDASTILIDPIDGLDPHTLEHLLIDQALPRLLAGQGQLMVHASLVRIGTQAALFLGRSGWGKSTLAGLLHHRGHVALCDDCAQLELRDSRAWATPSYPGLRLFQDSIDQAFPSAPEATPVSSYSSKQRVIGLSLQPEWLEPQPIQAIYLLDNPEHASETHTIEPMTPAAICMALVEHSFCLDPTDSARTIHLLRQAAALSRQVPAWTLHYPRDFSRQDEFIRLLLEHFDQTTKACA